MDCPVVIADGWLGTDDVTVDLQGRGNYLNKQFVARAIADADALLSLAHFKGHPAGGYGGAIKKYRGGLCFQAGQDEPPWGLGRRQAGLKPGRLSGERL